MVRLLQSCVLYLGFFEDGNIRIGILPECEKVLIGGPGFGGVA
jgi:hypothetical protein